MLTKDSKNDFNDIKVILSNPDSEFSKKIRGMMANAMLLQAAKEQDTALQTSILIYLQKILELIAELKHEENKAETKGKLDLIEHGLDKLQG